MTMFLNIEWIAGLPQYRDVTYLLRAALEAAP